MARLYLWAVAFFLLFCQLCAVFGDDPVSSSNLASSSDGRDAAMDSGVTKTTGLRDDDGDDGSCNTDEASKLMGRTEFYDHDYGSNRVAIAYSCANANFNRNNSDDHRGSSIDGSVIGNDPGNDIVRDIGFVTPRRKSVYLHETPPSVCPAPPLPPAFEPHWWLPTTAYPRVQTDEFAPLWKQRQAVMGKRVSPDDHEFNKYMQDMLLAEAHRAVAAGEPFTIDAFIAATERIELEETPVEEDADEKSLALSILEAVENATGYVSSLFKEILPAWINPTAGQIERADECFSAADSMPFRADWDSNATNPSSWDVFNPAAGYSAFNGSNASVPFASDISTGVADFDGGGWFYCPYNRRLVQQDPATVSLSNVITGRSAEPSSSYSSSPTEHFRDDDNGDDQDRTDSLLDALLAADRTHYEHEHMQLTLYVSLAPPSADLEDEDVHEGFEAVLEGIFEHDENEERQVALEMRIATDMQHLLFGAGEEKQLGEEEEPVSTVCYEAEYYSFVPPDTANTKCDLLPDDSQTPPMDDCTPPDTLHGNDYYASSRSDCHVYLQKFPFGYAPVSVEENASYFETPGSLFDLPEMTPQLDPQLDVLQRLIIHLMGRWTDAHETVAPAIRWLQSRLTEVLDHAMSLVDNGSTKNVPKLAQGSEAVPMSSFISASTSRTGAATVSRTVAKYAGIFGAHFGEFLPKGVNPARYMATRQAGKCFEEVDNMVKRLSFASSYAAMAARASAEDADAAGDATINWFFCAHTQSLVQMDPAVFALYDNALTLSPLVAADWVEEEDMQVTVAGHFGRYASLSQHEQQPAQFDGYGDDSDTIFGSGAQSASPDRDEMPDGDSTQSSVFCRPLGLGCRASAPRADAADPTAAATAAKSTVTTIVTTSQTTVITFSHSGPETTTITFSADTPTVGTHTYTIVHTPT